MLRFLGYLVMAVAVAIFSSCAAPETKPPEQAQAFGEPASTIPWNQPQSWEGGGGALGALRGNQGDN